MGKLFKTRTKIMVLEIYVAENVAFNSMENTGIVLVLFKTFKQLIITTV